MIDAEILLIEDNPDDAELTRLAFESSRISSNITVAEDGEKALEYLFSVGARQHNGRMPAIILLDLKLPKISGLEVLKTLRENESTKYIPVIILTSSKEEEDIISSYSLGANAYVRKPVDYNQFVKTASTLGMFWLVLNEPCPRKRT